MEDTYYDTYFTINTALYAAEEYIHNTYGVIVNSTSIQEYFGNVDEQILQPRYQATNINSIYTSEGYTLPSVTYIENNVPNKTNGPLVIERKAFTDVFADNLLVNYVSGFTYPPTPDFTDSDSTATSEIGDTVSTPIICNPNGSPLASPMSASREYYDLFVIGDPAASIHIDGNLGVLKDAQGNLITEDITPNVVINEDRIGRVTLDLSTGVNTFDVTIEDGSGNVSNTVTLVINKQDEYKAASPVLLKKDLVTNTGTVSVTVQTTPGSTIQGDVGGAPTTYVAYSSGVDTFEVTLGSNGLQEVTLEVTSPLSSNAENIQVVGLVDDSLTDAQVQATNYISQQDTEMPQDLLMALLMIANHYFKIALYKHDETHSYGDNVSNRTTFVADRFPKDAHMILSKYVTY
jgi:hypothetical protein